MSENMSPIDMLLDENNTDNITLYDENANPTEFEQVAIIPINERIYVILTPAQPMEGVEEDEGLVFSIDVDADGYSALNLVTDEDIINKVFDLYIELIEKGE